MSCYRYFMGLLVVFGTACEDVIDVDLKDVTPQLVIIGEVSNRLEDQYVTISRTVAFSAADPFDAVSDAEVTVFDDRGKAFEFVENTPGRYQSRFRGEVGRRYQLQVRVDGQTFEAVSSMPESVLADSIGTGIRNVFNEEQKFISVKYQDPIGVSNYYRYLWSINGAPPKMVRVSNDKFTDGKYVSEDVTDFETELDTGDSVSIWMQCIDKATFDFWNAVQANNPGNAAPANPPSAFGNGALGYFSAQAVAEYFITVQ
ncbi:DUF4249 domain-containing protein [Parapedobacter defluvii]|uniref:DUF4249 domain-containing protein n=1 Tax=Parapedobacter defluvii TaxID=2045106 RepID=UPI00334168CD